MNAVLRLKNHRWVVVITQNKTVIAEIPFAEWLHLPAVKDAIRHVLAEQHRVERRRIAE